MTAIASRRRPGVSSLLARLAVVVLLPLLAIALAVPPAYADAEPATIDVAQCGDADEVDITSTKDISNVVLEFTDGTVERFNDLSGLEGTFSGTGDNAGKTIEVVWVKSGNNKSGDGPGYGERFDDFDTETCDDDGDDVGNVCTDDDVTNDTEACDDGEGDVCADEDLSNDTEACDDQGDGGSPAEIDVDHECAGVSVTSTKDISNVVLQFTDGTVERFNDLSGLEGTFSGTGDNAGKTIEVVWVKSGNNKSGDGPGYGERFDDFDTETCDDDGDDVGNVCTDDDATNDTEACDDGDGDVCADEDMTNDTEACDDGDGDVCADEDMTNDTEACDDGDGDVCADEDMTNDTEACDDGDGDVCADEDMTNDTEACDDGDGDVCADEDMTNDTEACDDGDDVGNVCTDEDMANDTEACDDGEGDVCADEDLSNDTEACDDGDDVGNTDDEDGDEGSDGDTTVETVDTVDTIVLGVVLDRPADGAVDDGTDADDLKVVDVAGGELANAGADTPAMALSALGLVLLGLVLLRRQPGTAHS